MDGMNALDYEQIEPRIRPHVKALREAGYETAQSCGHDMWVTIDLPLQRLPELRSHLLAAGYTNFILDYVMHSEKTAWDGAKVTFGGALTGDGGPREIVLLKVDPEAHPLYFVIVRRNYGGPDDEGSDAYFYGEHTCPTNWTDQIVAVISKGDDDPHGFATFVKKMPAPDGMDDSGDINGDCNTSWLDLFPEARG